MTRIELKYLFLALLLSGGLTPAFGATPDSLRLRTPGELRAAVIYGESGAFRAADSGSKNVPLALGMSALIPGLGQAYNDDWVKAAVAAAVEGGLITAYFIWRERGLEGEQAYKDYAHAHWSPGRYADWLNDYVSFLNEEHGASIDANPIDVPAGIDFGRPESWSAAERQAVRSFFNGIRAVEDEAFHPETGASFSHKLPYFGEQQYYELIGKYFQFAPGWGDYPPWLQEGEFTEAIDPELTGSDGSKPNIRGRFVEYAENHADANTLLRRASRASAFIALNHVLAAVDAAISAKLANDRLATELRFACGLTNEPEVLASVRWTF